ncbi:hypothetical protein CEXT_651861 [Caerostris extrusa]|uniref:Uncharacterized protein n=1 Tax=Caerostris extrusa TaxID=172846 RepID=A0AAV4XAE1_CAEEX|nr:hypothetical protein CEXT_651861 [Caerostris extrusa]
MQVSWNEWLRESGVRNAGFGNRVNGALTGPFLGILFEKGSSRCEKGGQRTVPFCPPQTHRTAKLWNPSGESPIVRPSLWLKPLQYSAGGRRVPHGGEGPIWAEGERRGRSSLAMGSCA